MSNRPKTPDEAALLEWQEALAAIAEQAERDKAMREENWQDAVRRSQRFVGKYQPILYGEGEHDYDGCLFDDGAHP